LRELAAAGAARRHHRYIFEEKEKRVLGAPVAKAGKAGAAAKQKVVQARLQVRWQRGVPRVARPCVRGGG